jgi:hypothetical protein
MGSSLIRAERKIWKLIMRSCRFPFLNGYAPGTAPSFYHTWYLKTRGDACLVVTDEVGKGKDAVHLRDTDEGLMHRGHELWRP